MSLNKTLEEINKLKPILAEDISNGPRETYAGREGRQRNAKDQYKRLKDQYTEELRLSSTFILVCGTGKEQFEEIAKNEYLCFTADAEGFYKDLANRLPAELYSNKPVAGNLFDIMGRHLEDKANELGITGYPLMVMKQQYMRAIKGKEDFVDLIKQAINEQVGSEITGIHVVKTLTDQAIEKNHNSTVTPIVMTVDDETLALDFSKTFGRIGAKVFLVAAGKGAKTIKASEGTFAIKEVDSENVKNVLTNIARLCKTQ